MKVEEYQDKLYRVMNNQVSIHANLIERYKKELSKYNFKVSEEAYRVAYGLAFRNLCDLAESRKLGDIAEFDYPVKIYGFATLGEVGLYFNAARSAASWYIENAHQIK